MPVKKNDTTKKININKDKNVNAIIVSIAAVLVLSIIVSIAAISSNKKNQQPIYDFGKKIAQGIDVSEHNKDIDWEKVKSQYDFAFIRVGYRGYSNGEIVEDKNAKDNMKNAQKAGIPFGVYFYSQAVSVKEAKEEAAFVLDMIKKFDVSLPVVIDFEYAADSDGELTGRLFQSNLDSNQNSDIINAFCEKVQDKGHIAGVYAASSVFHGSINTDELSEDTVIWVADYNDKVTYKVDYTIWQYSKTGTVDGVGSKYVDLNYWYKN